jgi:hypothetical protein
MHREMSLFASRMIWQPLGSNFSTGVGGRGALAIVDIKEVGEVRREREG